jgi:peptide/nickel transport system permease protein
MTTYIIRRLIMAVIVLFLVSLIIFFAMRLLPGDPIKMLVSSQQQYSEEQITQLRHEFGLDKPLVVQYFTWIGGIFHGDFGTSILGRTPVADELFKRLPITLHLGLTAFIIGLLIGIPAGVISAVRRGKWIDTLVVTLSNLGITMPIFWLGFILIYIFALHFKLLEVQGYTSPFTDFWLSVRQMVMPVACLSIFPIASISRQTRSSMLEVIRQDYIRTAWSKGLKEQVIIIRHALKNGLIPVITISGVQLSILIGGAVITESVFNIPGMGRLAVSSVLNQDYPYVQGIILIIATFVSLVNLIVDLAYGWLDPRIRYS